MLYCSCLLVFIENDMNICKSFPVFRAACSFDQSDTIKYIPTNLIFIVGHSKAVVVSKCVVTQCFY